MLTERREEKFFLVSYHSPVLLRNATSLIDGLLVSSTDCTGSRSDWLAMLARSGDVFSLFVILAFCASRQDYTARILPDYCRTSAKIPQSRATHRSWSDAR